MSILYISYDGMLEPLGQSQVLTYLRKLALERVVFLISFEKQEDWKNKDLRESLIIEIAASGIVWRPLRYHKKPSALATAWDIICGTFLGTWLVLRHRLTIVHARSYVSSVMALFIKRFTGVKYLFDMRGFWADERVDGNIWPRNSKIYKISKWFERRFLMTADHIVSLTNASVKEIEKITINRNCVTSITVIPTCADLTRFKPIAAKSKRESFVLGYVGSAGTWYMFDEVLECFKQLLKLNPEARLLIVNRGEHEFIRKALFAAVLPEERVELIAAVHDEMPKVIARMDAGIFFIRPVYSKLASAPTKLAEFLGCGVPCLSNAGVGDMEEILEGECVGVAVKNFDEKSLVDGLMRLQNLVDDELTSVHCVAAAQKYFSLEEGVRRYKSAYFQLDDRL